MVLEALAIFGTKSSEFCREDCIELWMISYVIVTMDNANDYDKMEDFLNNLRNSIRHTCLFKEESV